MALRQASSASANYDDIVTWAGDDDGGGGNRQQGEKKVERTNAQQDSYLSSRVHALFVLLVRAVVTRGFREGGGAGGGG